MSSISISKCYFENFFDLQTDYDDIKSKLQGDEILRDKVIFGQGIRILRQNLLEVVVSFCISANNNIKRITKSLFYLREKFGNKKDGFFAFPTLNQLSKMTENDFLSLGVGYRAKQLVKLVSQLQQVDINSWTAFDTDTLRAKLVALSGIGPKVADCILLFGYGRTDVFPVDTWIAKSFKKDFQNITDRKIMRQILVQKYQNLAGYAQQYMFFYAREHKIS